MVKDLKFVYRRTFRRDRSRIVHAFLKISSKCNFMCSHCYESPNQNIRNEIDLPEYERFAKQLDELLVLTVTGGEPFIHKNLTKIINSFRARNVMLTSNGFFPERILPVVEEVLKANPSRRLVLAISLDGQKELHNKIRINPESYDKAVETVRQLMALRPKHPNFRVKVNTVLLDTNIDTIGEFMDDVYETMKPDFHSILLFMDATVVTGQTIDQTKLGIVNAEAVGHPLMGKLEKARDTVFQKWDRYQYGEDALTGWLLRRYNRRVINESIKTIQRGHRTFECQAGKSVWRVNPHGDIRPCHWLPEFGNVKTDRIEDILKSEAYKRTMKGIKNHECSCIEHSIFYDNFLLNPFEAVKLFWE